MDNHNHFKDDILADLAKKGNVAQFVSYSNTFDFKQRHLYINGLTTDSVLDPASAIAFLLKNSSDGKVNVRSFLPEQPKGHPFAYGLTSVEAVIAVVEKNAEKGRFSIVNETIDINDGGVSGVVLGNIVEFTPNDTPKGVDKPGVCSLTKLLGYKIIKAVYGVDLNQELSFDENFRIEFSVHPAPRGVKQRNVIVWERELFDNYNSDAQIAWPNNFSKLIGDKVFGLLVAEFIGLNVPKATVINRHIAPFLFGQNTGQSEVWFRTAPVDRTPGRYPTYLGWQDPFLLLSVEDPVGDKIASVMSQQGVKSVYSGSLLTDGNNQPFIEGRKGKGDVFMSGSSSPEELPEYVILKVSDSFKIGFEALGPIELEWVCDGTNVWIVQLHRSKKVSVSRNTIVSGTPEKFATFNVSDGLEKLRELISSLDRQTTGVKLLGKVGLTSHFGDLLRKANIPSIIEE